MNASRPTLFIVLCLCILPSCTGQTEQVSSTPSAIVLTDSTKAKADTTQFQLPVRDGERQRTSGSVPHVQVGFQPDATIVEELFRRAFSIPGIENRPTRVSLPGGRGMWLSKDIPVANPKAIVSGRLLIACKPTPSQTLVDSADLDRFWSAYDLIVAETDSSKQLEILNEEFISKASAGQQLLFEVRNYTPEEYIQNIRRYPKFYTSLRKNFSRKDEITQLVGVSQSRLHEIYPAMSPARVSMGMGNMRTPATTVDSLVLIGAELSFGASSIDTSEFPPELDYVTSYFQSDPIDNVGFLGVHEFIHTQQVEWFGTMLLSAALREGSAEFIAEVLTKQDAPGEILSFGKGNRDAIFETFKKEMFNRSPGYWLWNDSPNPFGQRDLGYFVGYEMARHYYEKVDDKNGAIAELIELDYADADAVKNFVDGLGYFEQSIADLEYAYEQSQAKVLRVDQDGDLFTIHFSQPMDTAHRGFDYGPLGEDYVLPITEVIGFSSDSLSMSVRANVVAGSLQQLTISPNFRNIDGIDLQPFVLEVEN